MNFGNFSGHPKVLSRLVFVVITVLTLSSFIKNQVSAKSAAFDFESVDDFIQAEMETIRIPGLALAIVHGDEIVYQKGFGIADASGNPVTPQTPFNIGSVSKAFTALAVMQLAEDGKLELGAPVQRYLPWFRVMDAEDSSQITILDLLNHTSGIPTTAGNDYSDMDEMSDLALERRVRALSKVELDRPVGTSFKYSNANYDVLGLIVQVVAAQSYEQVIQQNIFVPLNMNNSFLTRAEADQHEAATGYRMWFGFPLPYSETAPRAHLPSGQQFSSAEDLAHLLIAHLNDGTFQNNSILSASGIESMHSMPVESGAGCATYSMHWSHDSRCNVSALAMGGDTANFKARLLMNKDEKLAVVVLMNVQAVGINGPRQDRIEDGVFDLIRGRVPTSTGSHNIPILAGMVIIGMATFSIIISMVQSGVGLQRRRAMKIKHRVLFRLIITGFWVVLLAGMVQIAAGALSERPLAFMLENIPDLGWMIILSAIVALGNGLKEISILIG